MKKTTHYQLNKPESGDPLRLADFNQNSDILDAALNNLNAALGGKAEQSALAAVTAAAPKIAVGSYVGTGTWGAGSPNSLTFDFVPKLIAISGPIYYYRKSVTQVFVYGATEAYLSYYDETGVAQVQSITGWGTNTISWYSNTDQEERGTYFQMNAAGKEYHYVAIG